MPRRFIDTSVALDADLISDPPMIQPQIEHLDHQQTAGFFPGLHKDQLPESEDWALESLQIATHNGTHLDAPYHHRSTMNRRFTPGGERAMTIDQVPLEWCFSNGFKLDFRHMEDGYVATV